MSHSKNTVFIATSLDGYIADKNGALDYLGMVPNPDNIDMGYKTLIQRTDALIMGRTTFETVCSFDIPWPYSVPVFVLSSKLTEVPVEYKTKVELVKGELKSILEKINNMGYHRLYIDGGKTIQSFLKEDLIDELIVTQMPILLGGGSSLFAQLPKELELELVDSKVYLGQIVQSHYKRKK